jgi:hypothetical protein
VFTREELNEKIGIFSAKRDQSVKHRSGSALRKVPFRSPVEKISQR